MTGYTVYKSLDGTLHDNFDYIPRRGDTYEYTEAVSILLCGDNGAGKSLIFSRYFNMPCDDRECHNSCSFVDSSIDLKVILTDIRQTQPKLRLFSTHKYHIVIYVFDTSSMKSFNLIQNLYQEYNANDQYDKTDTTRFVLLGNSFTNLKNKERVVQQDVIQEMVSKYNMTYFETDVDLDGQVPQIIDGLVRKVGVIRKTQTVSVDDDEQKSRCTIS